MASDAPPSGDGLAGGCWFAIALLALGILAFAGAIFVRSHTQSSQPSSAASQPAASAAACSPASFTDFRDLQFRDEDWTDSMVGTTTLDVARFDVDSVQIGGPNASGYRSVHHVFAGRGAMYVLHLQRSAVYDPSGCGRITSIDATYWVENKGAPRPLQFFAFAVRQGASVYLAARATVDATAWTQAGPTGLHESDFSLLDGAGPPHPSFTGATMEFGYVTANSCGLGTAGVCVQEETKAAMGDWHVRVHR